MTAFVLVDGRMRNLRQKAWALNPLRLKCLRRRNLRKRRDEIGNIGEPDSSLIIPMTRFKICTLTFGGLFYKNVDTNCEGTPNCFEPLQVLDSLR